MNTRARGLVLLGSVVLVTAAGLAVLELDGEAGSAGGVVAPRGSSAPAALASPPVQADSDSAIRASAVRSAAMPAPTRAAARDAITLEAALTDPREALLFAHRADLSKLDEETLHRVCRLGASVQLGDISDSFVERTVESYVQGEVARERLGSVLNKGLHEGHSLAELEAIRTGYEGVLTQAANSFCGELRGAVRRQWQDGGNLIWGNEDVDPGYGDREGKCVLARAATVGPFSYRIVVYAEDHPRLYAAREALDELTEAVWRNQMEYLEQFARKK